jgi:hypothetical protein
MLNMETLDKVIALVVVLLALSLFIQSLQALLKKLFKIKSLQIEQSLVHLYHYVLEKDYNPQQTGNTWLEAIKSWGSNLVHNSPVMRTLVPRTQHPSERDPEVDALFKGVAAEFKKVGRVTQTGRLMMDSISRDDLVKFMNRMPVAGLITRMFANMPAGALKGFGDQVAKYPELITELKSRYQAVVKAPAFETLEKTLSPILSDLGHFLSGASLDSGKLLADMAKLREIDPQQVSQLVSGLPLQLEQIEKFIDHDTGSEDVKKLAKETLEKMKAGVKGVTDATNNILKAFATVQGLKTRVETWYDTVMQGFEERYTRGMKTWTVVISALVVIIFNINVLNIYREISASSAKREVIVASANKLIENMKDRQAKANSTTTNTPATSPSPSTTPAANPSPTNTPVDPGQLVADAKSLFTQENINYMTDIGLKGPKWITEIPAFFKEDSDIGKQAKQAKDSGDNYYRLKLVGRTVFGWALMTLLLSAGAPFWEDTLETLFGLKNKMRKETETRNVERTSGSGNPKT